MTNWYDLQELYVWIYTYIDISRIGSHNSTNESLWLITHCVNGTLTIIVSIYKSIFSKEKINDF